MVHLRSLNFDVRRLLSKIRAKFPSIHTFVLQILLTTELFYAYGFVATLSPIGIGRIAFSTWLYISAMYLSKEDFREICQIWPYN